MEFSVWAPEADRVELDLLDRRVRTAMAPAPGGWWKLEVAEAGPGVDYGFRLDGSDLLPDPRSPSQPQGVHGPSRTVDHGAFTWTDGAWSGIDLRTAVLYELHVGTFSDEGTFDGVIARLDHLVALGVTAVEVMPVAEFPGTRNWGYDGVALFAPHHGYGGPDGLKRLVDACHQRGLGVVLDVVYNHLGPEGNHLERFGPYFTDAYVTPWGTAVNFDRAGSDDVRRFVVDNALSWFRDYHVDALRLDAVHAIIDLSATHVLEQLAVETARLGAELGRPLHLIAESDQNDPRLVRDRATGGYGLDAQWSDDFHHALHVALTGERGGYYVDFTGLADVAAALRRGWPHAGSWSEFRGRTHGRPYRDLPGWRLLGYSQTHDQVGNRATGDRLSQLVPLGRLKIAAALVLTAPFVPLLFMGEEWGASTPFQYFTSHADPALAGAVRDGRRREFEAFGWAPDDVPDPQDPATFERSKLDWSEHRHGDHAALLEWYRDLIALRRATPELLDGRLDRVTTVLDGDSLTVVRGRVMVRADLASDHVAVDVDT